VQEIDHRVCNFPIADAHAVEFLLYEYAAVYVDKLLKGANPASLTVDQPSQFQVTVNSKTAQARGLSLPPVLLAQIDEVID
jgi:putative ABC transport system substrate-binding protein